jgi:hypothetical protein
VGEVVVRGPTLMPGYDDDAAANAAAFVDGWFRTGDQGYLDAGGYLFITGRLKELINRGGEKVAPAEVEAVLAMHPSVLHAAAFAVPDAALGEVVGAAVVLRPGHTLDELALRHWAAERLAEYKVPRRIVAVAALPKGPTGKVQRVGLAEKLGLTAPEPEPVLPVEALPHGAIETRLAEIWRRVLRRAQVGRRDRFLDLGGDSLLATQLVARVAEAFALDLSLVDFFDAPTIAEQAALLALLLPPAALPESATEHISGSV